MCFLRQVEIDLATFCFQDCSETHREERNSVSFVKLAQLIWSPAAAKLNIKFTRSGTRTDYGLPAAIHVPSAGRVLEIDTLSAIIKCLRVDTADPGRYTRQVVKMDIDVTWAPGKRASGILVGNLAFGHSKCAEYDHLEYHLALTDDMRTLERRSIFPTGPTLLGLPPRALQQIYREVLTPHNAIFLDPPTGEYSGVDIGLLSVKEAKYKFYTAKEMFWNENNFTLRLRSSDAVTSFGSFQALEPVICLEKVKYGRHCPWGNRTGRHDTERTGSITLQLEVESDTVLSLADVRVDMKDVIRLTSSYTGAKVSIRFSLSKTGAEDALVEGYTTVVYAILVRMAAVLSCIAKKYPNILKANDFELYVDGHGNVKSVEIRDLGEPHIFQEGAFYKFDGFAAVVAQYGAFRVDHYDRDDQYDGTLWCWVRYLEESIACIDEESEIWLCHVYYFGTDATSNNNGRPNMPKNQLLRIEGTFSRPGVHATAMQVARQYKDSNGRVDSMKGI
jgi:hypothetical protein